MSVPGHDQDVRWRQRLHSFRKAFRQLSGAGELASNRPLSQLEQQGLIQTFEFTHELAWNVLKDFLESRGSTGLFGSRDATRQAFASGLLENGETWMAMIASRNRSSHTYDEATANEIASIIIREYLPAFDRFEKRFAELELT